MWMSGRWLEEWTYIAVGIVEQQGPKKGWEAEYGVFCSVNCQ